MQTTKNSQTLFIPSSICNIFMQNFVFIKIFAGINIWNFILNKIFLPEKIVIVIEYFNLYFF